jgi:hypothetical protein
MTDASKPSLLDQLREQSEVLRAHDTAARKPIEEALHDIDRRLWRTFRWLDEALGHLEVIRPTVTHQFQLTNILTLDRPQFERGFVMFRRRPLAGLEVLDHVEMFYRLTGPQPVILRVNPAAATSIEDHLRGSTLQFQYQTELDERKVVRYGLFHIQPAISATVRFQPDYARQVIDVTLRNVDRFESVRLEFQPDRIDEATCEDLVKFMLGEPNGFLRRAPLALIKPQRGEPAPGQAAQRA